ncbi:hypothetical protein AAG906_025106 [Vitis piasezkii]
MVAPPKPPQTEQTQSTPVPIEQGELPTKTIPPAPASPTLAPLVPMPEAFSAIPSMTPTVPPVAPTTSEPSITISASEFRDLVATLQTLDRYTSRIRQHLGLLPPPQPNLPASSRHYHREIRSRHLEATTDAIASIDP